MYKILIIEDEKDTAEPVKAALEINGFSAEIAGDGQSGIDMLAKKEYDLILLDLKMPGISGEETLRRIRRKYPYIYVVVYTNYSDFTDIKALTNIGIDGYINKGPKAELGEIIEKVKELLSPFDAEGIGKLMGVKGT